MSRFVIATGVQIAIVFRKCSGGDGDAQTMTGGDHSRCEPQIDVLLVSLAGLEQRRPIVADQAIEQYGVCRELRAVKVSKHKIQWRPSCDDGLRGG